MKNQDERPSSLVTPKQIRRLIYAAVALLVIVVGVILFGDAPVLEILVRFAETQGLLDPASVKE